MTIEECTFLNIRERLSHQYYWHFLLEAMGEPIGICPFCQRKFTEDPKIWQEEDVMPTILPGNEPSGEAGKGACAKEPPSRSE